MRDVQRDPAEVPLPIDRVGVRHVAVPLRVRDRERGVQHTVAQVELGVELPAHFKGTHMSRFLEALAAADFALDAQTCRTLLADVRARLEARRAFLCFRFPYFLARHAPVTGSAAPMDYSCWLRGSLREDGARMTLGVEVPVMTVCPCSKAISREGAHSQRALVRMEAQFSGMLWIEDLIAIAQDSASSPVYPLLKREDEKHVTETAFAHPAFVEDVVRAAAQRLAAHPRVQGFRVEVESMESIHNHSAYACIESWADGEAPTPQLPRDPHPSC
ncbi:MAG: cyclohydrolase [Desulfomicrobiaceae bacterium]|jgi:GTP cyclohydrolase I|nr:cyclohydrolase [Desulfomicrobiaceae bacterium]MDK2872833.1 cyclohydrolase [Desulfomicrobiaceae bacterium]HCF05410.1 GTP cyclohydrolase I FolE2 [Desulfomicrobiaceae bacterium]